MRLTSIFLFLIFIIFLMFLLISGIVFLLSNVFSVFQKNIEFSPFEDSIPIEDLDNCRDSDGGVFFNEKGEIIYEKSFLFWEWTDSVVDECEGNILTEYYCLGERSVIGRGEVECENGCMEGRCAE